MPEPASRTAVLNSQKIAPTAIRTQDLFIPRDTSETLYQLSYRGYPMYCPSVSREHFSTIMYARFTTGMSDGVYFFLETPDEGTAPGAAVLL